MFSVQNVAYILFGYVVKTIDKNLELFSDKSLSWTLSDFNLCSIDYENITSVLNASHLDSKGSRLTFYSSPEDVLSRTPEMIRVDSHINYLFKSKIRPISFNEETSSAYSKVMIKVETLTKFLIDLDNFLKTQSTIDSNLISQIVNIHAEYVSDENLIDCYKSNELKNYLRAFYNIIPHDPEEFTKFLFTKITGNSLFIKNKKSFDDVRCASDSQHLEALELLKKYDEEVGYKVLSQVFNRHKTFYLSLRTSRELRKVINKISKFSKKYHKPKMVPEYLQVTSNPCIKIDSFKEIFNKLDFSHKIKLASALKYRVLCEEKGVDKKIIVVRNGKGFISNISTLISTESIKEMYSYSIKKISDEIDTRLLKENLFIEPSLVDLALPTSGKKMCGQYPFGTKIKTTSSFYLGVFWKNHMDFATDIDLSFSGPEGKIGWDSDFTSEDSSIVFSGDIIDAPEGAAEILTVKSSNQLTAYLSINLYNSVNFPKDVMVPFSFVFGSVNEEDKFYRNDKNFSALVLENSQLTIPLSVGEQEKALGILIKDSFYFGFVAMQRRKSAPVDNKGFTELLGLLMKSHIYLSDLELPKSSRNAKRKALDFDNILPGDVLRLFG